MLEPFLKKKFTYIWITHRRFARVTIYDIYERVRYVRLKQSSTDIRHISGKENIVPDSFSGLEWMCEINSDKIFDAQTNNEEFTNYNGLKLSSGKRLLSDIST